MKPSRAAPTRALAAPSGAVFVRAVATVSASTAPACTLGLILLLSACDAPHPIKPGTPVIVVASASFSGSSSTQIFADGAVISDRTTPGRPPRHSVQHGPPEAYMRAAAVLRAEGKATLRALKPAPDQCLDYGTDQVTATPPVAGFDQASAACPDAGLIALMDHVLAALAPP